MSIMKELIQKMFGFRNDLHVESLPILSTPNMNWRNTAGSLWLGWTEDWETKYERPHCIVCIPKFDDLGRLDTSAASAAPDVLNGEPWRWYFTIPKNSDGAEGCFVSRSKYSSSAFAIADADRFLFMDNTLGEKVSGFDTATA